MDTSPIDRQAWWTTVSVDRRVLLMAPTMTSVHRLRDAADLFQGDLRVQLSFTVPPNMLGDGTEAMLGRLGMPLVPWRQAVTRRYDLAITANLGGIGEVDAPVVVFPHGASYNKRARPSGRGSIPVPSRVPSFARSALIQHGMLVPSAIVLGHDRELAMLAEDCPATPATTGSAREADCGRRTGSRWVWGRRRSWWWSRARGRGRPCSAVLRIRSSALSSSWLRRATVSCC